jgi:LmbE family N-acetylglucosaminyl deacetylase
MIVVLSPHLDDAIMSMAGTIYRLGVLGIATRIVTLFGGDPTLTGPPSAWDSKRGVATASEAFTARRDEDRAAVAVLGTEAVCLPYADAAYVAARDSAAIWGSLQPHLADAAAVVMPGSPLVHPDHEFTTTLALERLDSSVPVLFYAEQPYSTRPRYLAGYIARRTPAPLQHVVGSGLVWSTIHLDATMRATKARAVGCYGGELKALGARAYLDAVMERVFRQERIARRAGDPMPELLASAL